MGRAARNGNFVVASNRWSASDAPAERPRPAPGQALSRSLVALDQNSMIIAVIEMSQSSWLGQRRFPNAAAPICTRTRRFIGPNG